MTVEQISSPVLRVGIEDIAVVICCLDTFIMICVSVCVYLLVAIYLTLPKISRLNRKYKVQLGPDLLELAISVFTVL